MANNNENTMKNGKSLHISCQLCGFISLESPNFTIKIKTNRQQKKLAIAINVRLNFIFYTHCILLHLSNTHWLNNSTT